MRRWFVTWAVVVLLAGCTSSGPQPAPKDGPQRPLRPEPVTPELPDDLPVVHIEPHPETADINELLDAKRDGGPYRLQAGDEVSFSVFDHPDLGCRLCVVAHEPGAFPLIGEVHLAGKTLKEVQQDVRRRLESNFVTRAPVIAKIEKYGTGTVYLLGQVARAGAYEFPSNRPLNLVQLLAKAGDFLEDADTDHIRLVRDVGGERRFYLVSYSEIERAGRIELDLPLHDRDTLIVPSLPNVHILGQVKKPGAFAVPSGENLTLARAIARAGGLIDGADPMSITIFRGGRQGSGRRMRVALDITGDRSDGQDVPILPGDTVVVPEAEKIYIFGEVMRSGGHLPTTDGLTVTKLISLAGGFSKRANSNGTIVIRQTPSGQKIIDAPVSDIISDPELRQVRLLPGDIVFVPERFF